MICPHCGYKNSFGHWNEKDEWEDVKGEKGDFFELSNGIMMTRKRDDYWMTDENRELRGCPSCNKLFMD